MNIDVREYLRINPISVHELTLSGDGKDCFLYFSPNGDKTGFEVHTQNVVFQHLYQSIFGNLLDGNGDFRVAVSLSEDGVPQISWDVNADISDRFSNYVKRSDWNEYKANFESRMSGLINGIDQKILDLKRKAKLYYIGAVEPQTQQFRRSTWGYPNNPQIYSNFSYSIGQIWCVEGGRTIQEGSDEAIVGEYTVQHRHGNTKAEAMTESFSRNSGGGELVGQFRLGNNSLVAQDENYSASGVNMDVVVEDYTYNAPNLFHDGKLTYPLYGQNVLDVRTRDRSHNNVPPSMNVHTRYLAYNERIFGTLIRNVEEQISIRKAINELEERDNSEKKHAAEPQYESVIVEDETKIDNYLAEDLTDHDYLLRMTLDGSEIKLMKQSVQTFLDIFAEDAWTKFGKKFQNNGNQDIGNYIWSETDKKWTKNLKCEVTMEEILRDILDQKLVTKGEFVSWYNTQIGRMKEIRDKVQIIKELAKSMKPMNYSGRIIMSVTDDTEQKVIQNYGGKKWRRLTNFIRGVDGGNEEWGNKYGEEYVCLRQSNVPIHTHQVELKDKSTTDSGEWLVKGRGGEDTKIVNTGSASGGNGIGNASLEYQISPLEYEERDSVTLPHDNMPPFKEIYIWECMESTAEEQAISGEPPENRYTITWNPNGGTLSFIQAWSGFKYGQKLSDYNPVLPSPTKTGYSLSRWSDRYGNEVTGETVVTGDATYTAQWEANSCAVVFHCNGGYFPGREDPTITKTYKYSQKIGRFPEVRRDHVQSGKTVTVYSLKGWYSAASGGSQRTEETTVDADPMNCYAQWNQTQKTQIAVTFNGNNGDPPDTQTRTMFSGDAIGSFPVFFYSDHILNGWWTSPTGGTQVFERSTVDTDGKTFYAHWVPAAVNIIWDPQNGTPTILSPDLPYGSNILENQPSEPTRTGYTFMGWYDASVGGNPIGTENVALGDMTLYGHWRANSYTIRFNANGGSGSMSDMSMTYDQEKTLTENAFTRTHYTFGGWATSANGPVAYRDKQGVKNLTTVDGAVVTLYAKWIPVKYTITWNSHGGSTVDAWTRDYGTQLGTLPVSNLTGYALSGWYTAAVGGSQISKSTMVTGNATYHAHWAVVIYTVRYNGNRNTGRTMDDTTHRYGDGSTLRSNAYIRQYTVHFHGNNTPPDDRTSSAPPGNANATPESNTRTSNYGFRGWARTSFSNAVQYDNGARADTLTDVNGITITLYAVWNPVKITVPTVSRNGYIFNGWWNAASGGSKIVDVGETQYLPTQDTNLYAYWNRDEIDIIFNPNAESIGVTVTFDGNGGGAPSPSTKTVTFGSPYGALASSAAPAGRTFGGWYDQPTGGSYITSDTIVANYSDHKLYAHWTLTQYTVTFNGNGGSVSQTSRRVNHNAEVGALPSASRYGYTFSNWWTSPTEGTQISSSTPITSNVTFYAHWTANDKTLTVKANRNTTYWPGISAGGSENWVQKAYPISYGERYPAIPVPTSTGYVFKQWMLNNVPVDYPDRTEDGTYYFPEGTTDLTGYMYDFDRDMTMWAQWTAKTYTITVNANGGLYGGRSIATIPDHTATPDIHPTFGKSYYYSIGTAAREGYTFDGWYDSSDTRIYDESGSAVSCYVWNGTGSSATWRHDGNVVVYAHWRINGCTVMFNKQGGTGGTTSVTATYGSAMPSITLPTRNGYTFGGYYTAANGGGTQYYTASGASARNWDKTSDTELHAKWNPDYITVTYYKNY